MKKITMLFAAAFAACVGYAGALDMAWIKGTTDKNPLFYKKGETMVFTLELMGLQDKIPEGEYFLSWNRTGDDGKKDAGKTPLGNEPFVYKTSLESPGFVRLYAVVVDKDGKEVIKTFTGDSNSPEGRKAFNRFEKLPKKIFFDGGAGVEIDTLQARPEPDDFDSFWAKAKAKLAKVPMNVKKVEIPSNKKGVKMWAVSVDCAGPRPVTGYLSVPEAVAEGKKFKAQFETHGYSYFVHQPGTWGGADRICFQINAHGQLLPAMGGNDEYYKKLGEEINPDKCGYAFSTRENANPETAYFYGMVLRVMRGLQFLKTVEGWNGKDIIAVGGSQGGLQTIWAAACGEGVTDARSGITWCCDLGGEELGRNRGGWYIHWAKGLGYFDAVNFAKRIPSDTCHTSITRAGLGDYTCPPSGLAILWNNIKSNKDILWVQGSQHGYVPPENYDGRDFKREVK